MLIGSIPNVVGKDAILYLRKTPAKAPIDPCQTVLMVFCMMTCAQFSINDGLSWWWDNHERRINNNTVALIAVFTISPDIMSHNRIILTLYYSILLYNRQKGTASSQIRNGRWFWDIESQYIIKTKNMIILLNYLLKLCWLKRTKKSPLN